MSEQDAIESDAQYRALAAAHRKIGAVRKVVEEFWARKNSDAPHDHDTAWAAHVALVELAQLVDRKAAP